MINTSFKLQAIEGLSKRDLIKLEKAMKRQESNKSKNDGKSYKRKAPKDSHPLEPQPRKLPTNQQTRNQVQNDQKSNSVVSNAKVQNPSGAGEASKKPLQVLKPYNPKFLVEGGEEGLFDYMITYVCAQKQKQLESQYQDLSFLDALQGKQLEMVENGHKCTDLNWLQKKLLDDKQKIKHPFDQNHKRLLKDIKLKDQSPI